jgi:4-amino-4-deoxy-L-arabinose transferase-like glycosyltransferase
VKRQAWIVLGLVVLLRAPFLNQAIQGDDVKYIALAEHAQIEPLHPKNTPYVFEGKVVDMRGHPHPPLNAWVLAGLLAAAGDVYEVPYHAAYIVFSAVAALAMWSLARRFTQRPMLATLLFLATPAFVVNGGSLESDLPFLAFWMAAAALFVSAADRRSAGLLAASCLAMGLAAMAAFQAVVLAPVLAVYLWLHQRRWRAAWLALGTAPLILLAWQAWERASTGALPAAVLAGYFETYNLQSLANKLRNAAALTGHAAWLVFPALALAASRRFWPAAAAAAAAGFFIDPNPLWWLSFAVGAALVIWLAAGRPDFLRAWALIFFASALALFFAGSARYLLPMAAPVALIVAERLRDRPRWLAAGFALQMALGLALAAANYHHWDGYRRAARALAGDARHSRVWTNGEWGLRFYMESEGGLPLRDAQPVEPGEIVVSSELAYPISFTTGGGRLTRMAEWEIRSPIPLRLIGLDARSAWSTVSLGLRPFDISAGVIDRVRADVVVAQAPVLEYLPMNAPEADSQIASGIYKLEENRYRWAGGRAVVLLKSPAEPMPLSVTFYIPPAAPARQVALWLDGVRLAERTYPAPGLYTLATPPVAPGRPTASAAFTVDKTFSPPGDQRVLGAILSGIGFRK